MGRLAASAGSPVLGVVHDAQHPVGRVVGADFEHLTGHAAAEAAGGGDVPGLDRPGDLLQPVTVMEVVVAEQVLALAGDDVHHVLRLGVEHDLDVGSAVRLADPQPHGLGHPLDARLDRGGLLGLRQAQDHHAHRIVPAAELVELGIGRFGVAGHEVLGFLADHLRRDAHDRDRRHGLGGRGLGGRRGRRRLGQGGAGGQPGGAGQGGGEPVRHGEGSSSR